MPCAFTRATISFWSSLRRSRLLEYVRGSPPIPKPCQVGIPPFLTSTWLFSFSSSCVDSSESKSAKAEGGSEGSSAGIVATFAAWKPKALQPCVCPQHVTKHFLSSLAGKATLQLCQFAFFHHSPGVCHKSWAKRLVHLLAGVLACGHLYRLALLVANACKIVFLHRC